MQLLLQEYKTCTHFIEDCVKILAMMIDFFALLQGKFSTESNLPFLKSSGQVAVSSPDVHVERERHLWRKDLTFNSYMVSAFK